MKNYKLHLIRHGLTQGNLDGVYVGGGLDMPLCEEGIEQLDSMMARFQYPTVGMVFSSPMKRALQTAEILFPNAGEKLVLEELRENNFGEFEGRSVKELSQDPHFTKWLDSSSGYVPEGGESGQAFAIRTARALGSIFQHMMEAEVFEAACVTHGGVIMSMLGQKAMPRKLPAEWMSQNGCGFIVQTNASMLMRDDMVEVTGTLPYGMD